VKDLNGTYLRSPGTNGHPPIHITTFEIPVVYASVLSEVPPLHLQPPELPDSVTDPGLPPPPEGYDLIIHVGVGTRGGISLEKRGRKEGYLIPDYEGKLAPVVGPYEKGGKDTLGNQVLLSDAIRHEIERASGGSSGSEPDDPENAVRRGFGEGYEEFPDEIWNSLDCDQIVGHLRKTGFEDVRSSDDAGLYLCEFINYCALAESRRSTSGKKTEVLFVHVPPDGETLTVAEDTKGLKGIVEYVCWDIFGKHAQP